jgi:hypothetical protein
MNLLILTAAAIASTLPCLLIWASEARRSD